MKKKIALILCTVMVSSLFAGCGSTRDKKADSTDKKDTGTEKSEISIWHDGDEGIMDVLEEQVNSTLASDNISVKFEKKSGLTDQIKLYGNDEESGPDLYMYAHDSLKSSSDSWWSMAGFRNQRCRD